MKYFVRDKYGFVEYLRYDPEWQILLRVIYSHGPRRMAEIGVTRYVECEEPTTDVRSISEAEFYAFYDEVLTRLHGWRRKRRWLPRVFRRKPCGIDVRDLVPTSRMSDEERRERVATGRVADMDE
ncbi:hypothetical protein [Paraburkholderia sp. J12]|uniref:hypothetical protein n=1 Tax=Paraburkholderia sp. J12 TaxID=2805432 RepID=UPI002ABE7073|nr:hypothetical protein [Paraburkholderia sp. J12]